MGGNGKAAGGATPAAQGNPQGNPDPELDAAGYQHAIAERFRRAAHQEAPVIERLQQGFAEWNRSVSADEDQALVTYQSSGYRNLNRALRHENGVVNLPNHLLDPALVHHLDAVISRGRVPQAITVFRGRQRYISLAEARSMVGKKLTDHGYLSTSVRVAVGESYALRGTPNGTLYQIEVPAGSPTAWLHSFDREGLDEKEILLPRSSTFVVTGASQRADPHVQGHFATVIHMRLVPTEI